MDNVGKRLSKIYNDIQSHYAAWDVITLVRTGELKPFGKKPEDTRIRNVRMPRLRCLKELEDD
jgi:hypothetical protein